MRLTKRQLKRIIREEKAKIKKRALNESSHEQFIHLIDLLQVHRDGSGIHPADFDDMVFAAIDLDPQIVELAETLKIYQEGEGLSREEFKMLIEDALGSIDE